MEVERAFSQWSIGNPRIKWSAVLRDVAPCAGSRNCRAWKSRSIVAGQSSDALPPCSCGPRCYCASAWPLRKRETQSLVILGRFHQLLFPRLLESPFHPLRFHRRNPYPFRRLPFGERHYLQAHTENGTVIQRDFRSDDEPCASRKDALAAARESQWVGTEGSDQICGVRNQGQNIQSSRLTILPLSASTRRRRDSFTVLIISTS
jgi:hypothetical protein